MVQFLPAESQPMLFSQRVVVVVFVVLLRYVKLNRYGHVGTVSYS